MSFNAYVQGRDDALAMFKIAKARSSKKKDDETPEMRALIGAGAAVSPAVLNHAAVQATHLADDILKEKTDFSKKQNFRRLADAMGESDVKLLRGAPGTGAGMGYAGERRAVVLPVGTSEATAGHELGHAKNWRTVEDLLGQSGRKGMWMGRLLGTQFGTKTMAPLAASAALDDDASWLPGSIQAGIYAPTLLDEGLASTHALRHLIKRHGVTSGLRQGLSLAPAFGTYGAIGLTPLGITAGRKAWRRYSQNSDSKDTSSDTE